MKQLKQLLKHLEHTDKMQSFIGLINLALPVCFTSICCQFMVGGREEASDKLRRDKAGIV